MFKCSREFNSQKFYSFTNFFNALLSTNILPSQSRNILCENNVCLAVDGHYCMSTIVNNFLFSQIGNFPLVCLCLSAGALSCFALFSFKLNSQMHFVTVRLYGFWLSFINTSHLAHNKLNAQKTREKLGELKIRTAFFFKYDKGETWFRAVEEAGRETCHDMRARERIDEINDPGNCCVKPKRKQFPDYFPHSIENHS